VGAERVGAADGVFVTDGAFCFRVKKKIAGSRIIAAAEIRIRVVEFHLVRCFCGDDEDVTLTAAAGSGAADGVVGTLSGGTRPGGTFLGETLLGGTIAVGTFAGGTGLVGILLGGTGPGKTGLGRGWLVSAPEACGEVGRGT
jgi:hypothetical protein